MDVDVPLESIETKRKIAIVEEYHLLCQELAPYLRTLLNSRMPGNLNAVFETFKLHFDSLFMLTCDKKGLNTEVITPIKKWIDTKHLFSGEKEMREGLKLFDSYKAELFRMNVL